MKTEKLKNMLDGVALKARGAWARAVAEDARELAENIETEETPKELEAALLNGAENWKEYSYCGCALVYDEQRARHYCNKSELQNVTSRKDGSIKQMANARENWLDVQARALFQACELIKEIIKKEEKQKYI
jgi:hypothetical protein